MPSALDLATSASASSRAKPSKPPCCSYGVGTGMNPILLLSLLLSVLLAGESPPPAEPLPSFPDPAATVKALDQVMDTFFRRDQVGDLVDGFNRWQDQVNAGLKIEAAALKDLVDQLNQEAKRIDASGQRLRAMKPQPDNYNQLVDQHNKRVEAQKQKAEEYETRRKAFDERQNEVERQAKQEHAGLQGVITSYEAWHRKGEDLVFNQTLCQFYAMLRVAERERRDLDGLAGHLASVSRFRRELRAWAIRKDRQAHGGMLFVSVNLCGKEDASYLIDTGANSVTVSFAMVHALGLQDRLGDEATVTLAGGKRISGRRIILPSLTVQGQTLRDVEAVALPEEQVGIDGLLGHTFLDRFHYIIDSAKQPPLELRPLGKKLEPAAAP